MRKPSKLIGLGVIFCSGILLLLGGSAAFAQDQAETAKLYADIAGDYEFSWEGQTTVLTFFVRDGVLMGKAENDSEEEEVVLEPVEDRDLGFQTTNAQGMFIEMTFVRDENGSITRCLVNAMGMEIEGVKRK
jgi:hypothetical protein